MKHNMAGVVLKEKLQKIKLKVYIFHKNREISVLTMKKKQQGSLPQEATERTKQRETKNKTKNKKTH